MGKITWHIEPTSKCILECPLCDRTWFYEKFKRRLTQDINIDHLVNFLKDHEPSVYMCGNNGDPIYHAKFHELCRRLKKIKSKIYIVTNGSGKKKDWWRKLCEILTREDTIEFSIDGLKDTNHLYRINSKWDSVMDAIEVVTEYDINSTWKFIVFKQNEHQIKEAEQLSKTVGIKKFKLVKSDRWWKKDLMPSAEYVDPIYEHQISVTKGKDKKSTIVQDCMTERNGEPNNQLYIDSDGDFYPCCKTGLYAFRYKHIFSPKRKKYNIMNNTIEQILNDFEVKNFFDRTKSYDTADNCCKIYCGGNKTNH
jgi:sulfatase maturation enzyme AslB (radical SAM superfamily)